MNTDKVKPVVTEIFKTELGIIQSQIIKDFTVFCLEDAPEYFWVKPSSSSGKYHPPQSNGNGGLVRHVRAVAYFAEKLCEVYDRKELTDTVVSAALLHDIIKYGKAGGMNTVKNHDALSAEFVFDKIAAFMCNYQLNDFTKVFDQLNEIQQAVIHHMGRWHSADASANKKKFPDDFPVTSQIVHLADVISAQSMVNLLFL